MISIAEIIIDIKNNIKKIKKIFRNESIPLVQLDLIEIDQLDIIQNKYLHTIDGCSSVTYMTDKEIFKLCIQLLYSINGHSTTSDTITDHEFIIDTITKFNIYID